MFNGFCSVGVSTMQSVGSFVEQFLVSIARSLILRLAQSLCKDQAFDTLTEGWLDIFWKRVPQRFPGSLVTSAPNGWSLLTGSQTDDMWWRCSTATTDLKSVSSRSRMLTVLPYLKEINDQASGPVMRMQVEALVLSPEISNFLKGAGQLLRPSIFICTPPSHRGGSKGCHLLDDPCFKHHRGRGSRVSDRQIGSDRIPGLSITSSAKSEI